MGTLSIEDDCLTPERYAYLTYSGPDPWGVFKKITDSLKPFFHISTSSTNNDRLNWDISGDPITFYSLWWVKKKMSGISLAKITIKVQGEVSKTTNMGKFTLQLYGDLYTEFSAPSILLKSAWLLYSYLFYNKARQAYITECQGLIYNFRNEIKKHYNLDVTSVPERGVAFG
ncbi:MAG: hypothetical protein HY369_00690 [Candidatus Aenigmarchaeota archaeon]|nr:hypothetical protein [Candidatus Aenigmarchaeota archaeon]